MKCKICKEKFIQQYSTMQKTCLKPECITQNYRANKAIYHKELQSKEKITLREEKITLQEKVVNYEAKTQTKIQEIARLIDKGLNCLARNIPMKQVHGGHVYSQGGHSNFKKNLHNIHRQSAHSNHFQNDDRLMHEGVVREYGQEYLDFIKGLRQTPIIKLSNIEWIEKYKIACLISNRLKKKDENYSLNSRISLRNAVNLEIGIYDKLYCEFINL